uniref:UDP-glucose 4-epimerase n=1 Tax=Aureoumbra lagunensis TaxID=44058 RepID=A0A7S3ND55_9STRA|mmetsp:Transcript_17094/g.22163  ORF Transcript_17094/g.22163 Transcript_17094/m.22163 type:complete len:371 (+) Transcript_17094:40-1152(+)
MRLIQIFGIVLCCESLSMKGHVLVTGGAGYIGSHTTLCLLEAGYEVTVVDSLINSKTESLRRVEELTGKKLHFFQVDLRDEEKLDSIIAKLDPPADACIHFAGLKAVGESTQKPLEYYENNVHGTLILLKLMRKYKINKIIFSSSATVYGAATHLPITEESPTGNGITNAYGRTKYVIEEILGDFSRSPQGEPWTIVILRYFNPVGAHPSGRIGEDPTGPPNNLMPYVSQVAIGRRPFVSVFGNDYDTPDGTGVRDYLHVMDLAEGHIAALDKCSARGLHVYNLGTGIGYSVLEMIQAMEVASGKKIEYKVVGRRPGDIATVYADCSKALDQLNWKTKRNLQDMCNDLWTWQSANPQGYPGEPLAAVDEL